MLKSVIGCSGEVFVHFVAKKSAYLYYRWNECFPGPSDQRLRHGRATCAVIFDHLEPIAVSNNFAQIPLRTDFRVSVFRLQFTVRFSGGINGFGHCDHKPYLTTLLKNDFFPSATLGSGYLVPLSRPKQPNPRRRAGPKLIFRWYGKWCMAQTKLIAPVGCSGEVFVHVAAKKPHTSLSLQVLSESEPLSWSLPRFRQERDFGFPSSV